MAKNKILKLEDANGQSIETTVDEIFNMIKIADLDEDSDLTLHDNVKELPNRIKKIIVDSKGNEMNPTAIADAVKNDKKPIAADILIEVTHSGDNANSVSYRSDSMENDTTSFLAPFRKPFIKNHDLYQEPIGRVRDAYFGASDFVDRDTINVLFRVNDADAITKFVDGRYNTVSIGGSPKKVTCSICGKDIIKDGVFKFCGHWKGDMYNNQKAIWSCTDIVYNEVSVVNNPADKWAQVKKITLIYPEDEDQNKKVGDSDMSANIEDKDKDKDLLNQILGDEEKPAAEGVAEDNKAETKDTEGGDTNPDVKDGETTPEGEGGEPQITDAEKIADLEAKVATLTAEKETAVSDKETLETRITELEDEKTQLSDKLVVADAESKSARDQSLRLATKYKELLVDRVKDLRAATKGDVTDENIEAMSIKELNDAADEFKKNIPSIHKTPASVTNPGVVDNTNDPNVLKDDEDKKPKVTATDYEATEKSIIAGLVR